MNTFDLSKNWFDFCFENPELISPNHTAIYFFAIEHCNRLGWKEKFGFPSQMACDAIGIKKTQTFIKYFNELVEWGFFKLVQKSKNQYSSNIISLVIAKPKKGSALGKAIIKHEAKQSLSMGQSNSPINKPNNLEPNNNITSMPKFEDFLAYFDEKGFNKSFCENVWETWNEQGWCDAKGNEIKNWKSKLRNGWFKNAKEEDKKDCGSSAKTFEWAVK